MVKRGRCSYFRFFSGIIGSILLGSGCDSFPLVPAFVDDSHVLRKSMTLSYPSIHRRRGVVSALSSSESGDDDETKTLLEFLSPMSSCSVNQMSGTDLAYVGDVVFELFVRSRHVWPSKRTSDLQNTVVGLVRGTSFGQFMCSKFESSSRKRKLTIDL